MPQFNLSKYQQKIKTSHATRRTPARRGSSLNTFHTKASKFLLQYPHVRNQSFYNPEDPPRSLEMFFAGFPPKIAKEEWDSIKGTVKKKKNKLYWVKKHGNIEIMQRSQDGELRPLNWPKKYQKNTNCGTDGSVTSPFQKDTKRRPDRSAYSSFQKDTKRGLNRSPISPEYFPANEQNKDHHQLIELKGIESENEDSGKDYEYLSSRLDRLERELARNAGTKEAFAGTDNLSTHHDPTEERRRDVANPPNFHPPGIQREQHRGQSKNHLGSQYKGSQEGLAETEIGERGRRRGGSNHPTSPHPDSHVPGFPTEFLERESLPERSNHHPDVQLGLAGTEREEGERFRGRSNGPTSPDPNSRPASSNHLDPPSMNPRAVKGPKHRRRRGA